MTVRTIGERESLDTLWEELTYTLSRLALDPLGKEHAAACQTLLKRWDKVAAGQRAAWQAEITAQAAIDAQDLALDLLVEEIADTLYRLEAKDRTSARYRSYLPRPVRDVIRLGLASELPVVRQWIPSLTTEPEEELQRLGARLATAVKEGDLAVATRSGAEVARRDQRVREINGFIADVNGARQSIYGRLLDQGAKHKRREVKEWAAGFFRRGPASRRPRTPANGVTATTSDPARP